MTNAQLIRQPWDLTDEEMAHNNFHINKLGDALETNDENAIFYHRSQIFSDPDSLMAVKINSGASFIRENKLNTTLADRKFGHDWLIK